MITTEPDSFENQVRAAMFDKKEPRSVINLVWKDMTRVMEWGEHACDYQFKMSERQLKQHAKPEPTDDMLRLRFWQEYDRAQMRGQRMFLADITRGICSKDYWEDTICKNPKKLAWILMPLAPYITRMESNLYIAQDEIEDILRTPHKLSRTNKDGVTEHYVDTRLADLKVKIWEKLDLRIKGAVIQKVAIHQRIDQHTHSTSSGPSLEGVTDLQEIDKMLEAKKREIASAQNRELLMLQGKDIIEVNSSPTEGVAE